MEKKGSFIGALLTVLVTLGLTILTNVIFNELKASPNDGEIMLIIATALLDVFLLCVACAGFWATVSLATSFNLFEKIVGIVIFISILVLLVINTVNVVNFVKIL